MTTDGLRFGIHLPQFGRAAVAGAIERAAQARRSARLRRRVGERPPRDPGGPVVPRAAPVRSADVARVRGRGDRHRRARHERARRPAVHEPARARELAGEPRLPERRTVHRRHRHRLVGEGVRSVARAVRPPRRASRRDDRPCSAPRGATTPRRTMGAGTRSPTSTYNRSRPTMCRSGSAGRATPRSRAAFTKADGYHGIGVEPEQAPALVERIRAGRPDDDFTISLRVPWDARSHEPDEIKAQRDAYAAAGIQHLMAAPTRGSHRRVARGHGDDRHRARPDASLTPPTTINRNGDRSSR